MTSASRPGFPFAAIGANHNHIYGQTEAVADRFGAPYRSSPTGVAETLPIGPDHPAHAGWRPE